MNLIDKDALVAEIERRRDAALMRQRNLEAIGQETIAKEMIAFDLDRVISFINTLEVKEVDLDKILTEFMARYAYANGGEYPSAIDIAKHFFELGLKAKRRNV